MFHKTLGMPTREDYTDILTRQAVRAVIYEDNRLLMIYNKKGDYKFPGGGVELGEDHITSLAREVLEESGYIIQGQINKLGTVIERRVDQLDRSRLFEMTSDYYSCQVGSAQVQQKLDAYEAALEMKPVWVTIDEAITNNKALVEMSANPWLERELYVLGILKSVQ